MARPKRRKRKKPVVTHRPIEVTATSMSPFGFSPLYPGDSGDGDKGEAVKITVKAGGKTIKFTIE